MKTITPKSGELYQRAADILKPGMLPPSARHKLKPLMRLTRVAEIAERARTEETPAAVPPELRDSMKPRAFAELLAPDLARILGKSPYSREVYRGLTYSALVAHCEELASQIEAKRKEGVP